VTQIADSDRGEGRALALSWGRRLRGSGWRQRAGPRRAGAPWMGRPPWAGLPWPAGRTTWMPAAPRAC